MNFVDEQNVAALEIGENGSEIPAFSSTGPEVLFSSEPISLAMICASVVLPSPGGPNIRV